MGVDSLSVKDLQVTFNMGQSILNYLNEFNINTEREGLELTLKGQTEKVLELEKQRRTKMKFISYSGKYPCLCHGTLVIEKDGVEISFESGFMSSGGDCGFTNNYEESYINHGSWYLSDYKNYINNDGVEFTDEELEELLELVNDNIEYGCCGGCL